MQAVTHSNHYLDLLYLFMSEMLVLPRLSTLAFNIGKEDEMLTVNMVPAASYPAGYEEYFPQDSVSCSRPAVKWRMCLCVLSLSDRKQHHIAYHASPLQEQRKT